MEREWETDQLIQNFCFAFRIAGESANLLAVNRKATLTEREIQAAVKLMMPGELAAQAILKGTRALTTYGSGSNTKQ